MANSSAASSPIEIPDGLEYNVRQFAIPKCYKDDLKSIMISEGMIKDRIKKLAIEITDNIDDQPLTLICVLKGSYRFFTSLVELLSEARSKCKSHMTVDFIRAVSYEDTQTTGQLKLIGLSNMDELKDRNVIIVDDIIDTGLTLFRLIKTIYSCGAKKVWTTVLFSKRVKRQVTVDEHFIGFSIPNEFIIGYGLDYNQHFRDLNHVCILSVEAIERYKSSKQS